MAYTDRFEWFIGILDDGRLQLRRTRIIFDNGEEAGQRSVLTILEPGADVSGYPPKVRNVANVVWTPQVIAAWQLIKQGLE